jgi:DNA-binding winged helix-turn-helix (wHTH) protein
MKMKAASATGPAPDLKHFTFHPYKIEAKLSEGWVLYKGGERVTDLGQIPLKILALLVEHKGDVVPRRDLIEAGWPGDKADGAVLTARLDTAVKDLRKVMLGCTFDTVRGVGIQFDPPRAPRSRTLLFAVLLILLCVSIILNLLQLLPDRLKSATTLDLDQIRGKVGWDAWNQDEKEKFEAALTNSANPYSTPTDFFPTKIATVFMEVPAGGADGEIGAIKAQVVYFPQPRPNAKQQTQMFKFRFLSSAEDKDVFSVTEGHVIPIPHDDGHTGKVDYFNAEVREGSVLVVVAAYHHRMFRTRWGYRDDPKYRDWAIVSPLELLPPGGNIDSVLAIGSPNVEVTITGRFAYFGAPPKTVFTPIPLHITSTDDLLGIISKEVSPFLKTIQPQITPKMLHDASFIKAFSALEHLDDPSTVSQIHLAGERQTTSSNILYVVNGRDIPN